MEFGRTTAWSDPTHRFPHHQAQQRHLHGRLLVPGHGQHHASEHPLMTHADTLAQMALLDTIRAQIGLRYASDG